MTEKIILVDEQDNEIGFGEKIKVHQNEQLHRAFSVFIFDWSDHTMLIQKRALKKYHSGGLWTNACCSHPRYGEEMAKCINGRLREELGISVNVHIEKPTDAALSLGEPEVIYRCGTFRYFARYETLSENEVDHVYLYSPVKEGFSKKDFIINREEIDTIRWITIDDLLEWMKRSPNEFTAWFKQAFHLAYTVLCQQAKIYNFF